MCDSGATGKGLNADIAELVQKGLPARIQKALDIVRVVGNNAVHPGKLDDNDIAEMSNGMFELVNRIVEDQISAPKKEEEWFSKLTPGEREQIERRDGGRQ